MSATSQAFRNALHVPLVNPASGNVINVTVPGEEYDTGWSSASGLPEAPQDSVQYTRRNAAWVPVSIDPAVTLSQLKTVDGAGSGLDADFLDGLDSTAFATRTYVDTAVAILDAGIF